MEGGQRLKALDFVIPEKRELLVASGGMPFVRPKIVGIDFTDAGDRALVRVRVQMLAKDAPGGYLSWVVTDTWLWKRNTWYLDLNDAKVQNPFQANAVAEDTQTAAKELDSKFKVLQTTIDLGVILQFESRKITVPVQYSGSSTVAVDIDSPGSVVSAETPLRVGPDTRELSVSFNSGDWEGPFTFPISLKIRNQAGSIERQVSIKGTVFAPLTIRQIPSPFPDVPGKEMQILVHNASDNPISIRSVSSDDKFETTELQSAIAPKSDGVIRMVRKAGDPPNYITIRLSEPLFGKSIYDFRLRVTSAP